MRDKNCHVPVTGALRWWAANSAQGRGAVTSGCFRGAYPIRSLTFAGTSQTKDTLQEARFNATSEGESPRSGLVGIIVRSVFWLTFLTTRARHPTAALNERNPPGVLCSNCVRGSPCSRVGFVHLDGAVQLVRRVQHPQRSGCVTP